MTMFHKALAAALLSGAVGFAVPSLAATTDNSSSAAATSTDKGSTSATDTGTPAKPATSVKRAARIPAVDEEHSIVEALNQKSLEGVQSGQTPDYASAEPASHQQAEAARAAKSVVHRRTNNKANTKKGAG